MPTPRVTRRLALQVGALAGISLVFVGGRDPVRAAPPDGCQPETSCGYRKPLLLFLVDYSSSMSYPLGRFYRWDSTRTAISVFLGNSDNFGATHFIVGLARFGHDPSPDTPGTTLPGDTSGLVDGVKLDVPFYDPDAPGKPYNECGQSFDLPSVLSDLPTPPPGIKSWTRGGLDLAAATFAQAALDHPNDSDRLTAVVLYTDGPWTGPTGTSLAPPSADPALTAAELFDDHGIPTYVVAFAEAENAPFADQLAAAGGTGAALHVSHYLGLWASGLQVRDDLWARLPSLACTVHVPRTMLLVDASSSMLNLPDETRASWGEGGWDQVRDALAGDPSIFDQQTPQGEVQNLDFFGLAVFGDDTPAEETILVQYGACNQPNLAWALDPFNACGPGCDDPYAAPPVPWTVVDGSQIDPPGFDDPTFSHMPRCDGNFPFCVGSGSYTHRGIELVHDNITAYRAACMAPDAPEPCAADTPFQTILITDGLTDSTDAQVQLALQALHDDGVTTHIVGFAPNIDAPAITAQLTSMAAWGSGGALQPHIATSQILLESALAEILEPQVHDPCCSFNCAPAEFNLAEEPDPLPWPDSYSSTGETTATSSTDDSSTTNALTTTTTTATNTTTTTTDTSGSNTSTSTAAPLTTSMDPAPTSDPLPTPGSSEASSDEATTAGQTADPGGCTCNAPARPRDLAAPLLLLLALRRRPRHGT